MIPNHSLIIPAYNEKDRIIGFFDDIDIFDGELIVVCDGTDGTADIVDGIAARRKDLNIRCLRFVQRLGKGGGIIAGFLAAQAPLIGYCDADGSTSIKEMNYLFLSLRPSIAGVIGSRWLPESTLKVPQSILRRIESRMLNFIVRVMFGMDYKDTQCGAKVFKKSAIDTVLPKMISRGFEFDIELLWRLRNAGYRVIEVPITWQNREDSRVRKWDMIRMVVGLVMVRMSAK